ncbi:hypothetical protein [uncultured Photobacterium sp.]|uniref:hypothetical protein n=1 Tax=uncultured Photobacterium sp. TaxID=173973 RepID=UPI002632F02A|nr:hypothetical protein [uncultured Photobacterium sp.]
MRYFIILLTLVSFSSQAADYYWRRVNPLVDGYIHQSQFSSCDTWFNKNQPDFERYPNAVPVTARCEQSPVKDHPFWSVLLFWAVPSKQCPEGTKPAEYPSTECIPISSEENYCNTPEAAEAMDDAIRSCPNQSGNASCNHDTQQIEVTCSEEHGGEDPNGEGGDKPGTGEGDDENDDPTGDKPGTGEEGGDDTGGVKPEEPGGDDGSTDPDDKPSFCEEFPELCKGYEDCQTPEAPWLCDKRPDCDPAAGDICIDECDPAVDGDCSGTEGLIAAINEVQFAVRDHNKTSFDVSSNTKITAKNTKAIADNTNKANSLLTEIRDLNKSGNDILDNKMTEMMKHMDGINGDLIQAIRDKGNAVSPGNGERGGEGKGDCPEGQDCEPAGDIDCNKEENKNRLICLRLNGKVPTDGEDPFGDVLGKDAIALLDQDIEGLRDEISTLMDTFADSLGDVSLPESGNMPVFSANIHVANRSFTAKNDAWIENSDAIKSVVLALASLVAFSIILVRRK